MSSVHTGVRVGSKGCAERRFPLDLGRERSPFSTVPTIALWRKKIYTHHTDSHHSWLQVPITELFRLGVAHKISPYSHTDGTYAYLNEEDTVTFWWAREAMSQPCPCKIQLRATADPSPVRSLDRFAAPKAENGAGTIKIVAGFDSILIA